MVTQTLSGCSDCPAPCTWADPCCSWPFEMPTAFDANFVLTPSAVGVTSLCGAASLCDCSCGIPLLTEPPSYLILAQSCCNSTPFSVPISMQQVSVPSAYQNQIEAMWVNAGADYYGGAIASSLCGGNYNAGGSGWIGTPPIFFDQQGYVAISNPRAGCVVPYSNIFESNGFGYSCTVAGLTAPPPIEVYGNTLGLAVALIVPSPSLGLPGNPCFTLFHSILDLQSYIQGSSSKLLVPPQVWGGMGPGVSIWCGADGTVSGSGTGSACAATVSTGNSFYSATFSNATFQAAALTSVNGTFAPVDSVTSYTVRPFLKGIGNNCSYSCVEFERAYTATLSFPGNPSLNTSFPIYWGSSQNLTSDNSPYGYWWQGGNALATALVQLSASGGAMTVSVDLTVTVGGVCYSFACPGAATVSLSIHCYPLVVSGQVTLGQCPSGGALTVNFTVS